ncbi:MAG: triose-phosphate isomerase [Bdellovibrionales bacterium]
MSMSNFICAGNWKMNKDSSQAVGFLRRMREEATAEEQARMVILPQALIAHTVADAVKGTPIRWGGQNCYFEPQGAFTGENSPEILRQMGAQLCLVGHSERRLIFAEPDELMAKKVRALQSLGLIPLLCVGETADDRRWSRTREVILRQTRAALQGADPTKPLWLAYEPVWAIGTGQVATPEQVEEAHIILRKSLQEWSSSTGSDIPILYGGSVKSDNADSLAGLANVNGFLIGGASLDPDEFLRILRTLGQR